MSSIKQTISQNQKPLIALGVGAILLSSAKTIYNAYDSTFNKVTLKKFFASSAVAKNKKDEKPWLVLVHVDPIKDESVKYIEFIAKFCNLLIVWDNKHVSTAVFQRIEGLAGTSVRIVPFDREENLENFTSVFEAEIAETGANLLLIRHEKYSGETPFDKSTNILSVDQLEYLEKKLKIFFLSISSVVRTFGNPSGNKDTVYVLLDFNKTYALEFDNMISEGITKYLHNIKAKENLVIRRVRS